MSDRVLGERSSMNMLSDDDFFPEVNNLFVDIDTGESNANADVVATAHAAPYVIVRVLF
jgi:hypothetical protein